MLLPAFLSIYNFSKIREFWHRSEIANFNVKTYQDILSYKQFVEFHHHYLLCQFKIQALISSIFIHFHLYFCSLSRSFHSSRRSQLNSTVKTSWMKLNRISQSKRIFKNIISYQIFLDFLLRIQALVDWKRLKTISYLLNPGRFMKKCRF